MNPCQACAAGRHLDCWGVMCRCLVCAGNDKDDGSWRSLPAEAAA